MKALILNDGRLGHLNQSLGLVKLKGYDYDICEVRYRNRLFKILSYLCDRLHLYTDLLFDAELPVGDYDLVIGAGSTTAYPVKVAAKTLGAKSVAMMLPKGYRFDYDVIFAQQHDRPPKRSNIVELPVNFSVTEPQGLFIASKPSIGIIIGGDNAVFSLSVQQLKKQLDAIFKHFEGYTLAVTTSPRTSSDVETLLRSYPFDYSVYFASNPVNPIPDFLTQCERVFITQDSTSMISEAVANGDAAIEVLPLMSEGANKFTRLTDALEKGGFLHLFDGSFANANRKVDFMRYIESAGL